MGYQSKTWSLSDEVVAEIERRVQVMKESTGSGSPNRVLLDVLALPNVQRLAVQCYMCQTQNQVRADLVQFTCMACASTNYATKGQWSTIGPPPARELLVELDGDDK